MPRESFATFDKLGHLVQPLRVSSTNNDPTRQVLVTRLSLCVPACAPLTVGLRTGPRRPASPVDGPVNTLGLLFMLRAVAETSAWTTAKIAAIRQLAEHTAAHVRARLSKIYSRELVDVIFEQP